MHGKCNVLIRSINQSVVIVWVPIMFILAIINNDMYVAGGARNNHLNNSMQRVEFQFMGHSEGLGVLQHMLLQILKNS